MADHDHDHDHDHDRTVKPMVEEISDFEVLEIALRELCIDKGIFTAEEHRRFTKFAEQLGPAPGSIPTSRPWRSQNRSQRAKRSASTGSSPPGSVRPVTSP